MVSPHVTVVQYDSSNLCVYIYVPVWLIAGPQQCLYQKYLKKTIPSFLPSFLHLYLPSFLSSRLLSFLPYEFHPDMLHSHRTAIAACLPLVN